MPIPTLRPGRPLACALALLLATACGRAKPTLQDLRFPDAPVVLISVDTLRSDRLPMYGYAKGETPALDVLRKDSVLFERAYAHVPLTLPSHASLFTGALPSVTGVLDNGGYRLEPSLPTLAEILKKQGYATGGAVSTIVMAGASGLSRGFDFYDDAIEPSEPGQAANRVQRPGDESAKLLLDWLDRGKSEKGEKNEKVFAFLHLYEPHAPYEPREPFRSRLADPYDGEVATADSIVGEFLGELKKRGLYEKALVVFLSDHGEGLGDHGESEHGVFLYREAIQVPLLVKLPSRPGEPPPLAGGKVAAVVQLVDVLPTIAKAVGVPGFVPAPGCVSLLDLAAGGKGPDRRAYAETFFPRIRFGWSELRSLVDGRWQYIEAPKPELYDLESDPGELKNLVAEKSDPLRSMKADLEKRSSAFKAPEAVDAEQAKKLASLGYLTMASAPKGGPLPDPKDEIATLQLLKEGLGLSKGGRYAEAAEVLKRLLERNPRIVDAWEAYAQALVQMGRRDEALAAIRKTVELSPPDRTNYLISVANVCLQIGRPDEALANADLALSRGDTGAHEVKARAYLAKDDSAKAEAEAKASIASGPKRKRSYLVLAEVEARRGNFAAALEITDRVRASVGEEGLRDLAGYHYLRGNVLGRLNRMPEAEAELKEETRLFPRSISAWQTLAFVQASTGRPAEAHATLDAMIAAADSPNAYAAAIEMLSRMGEKAGADRYRAEAARKYPERSR